MTTSRLSARIPKKVDAGATPHGGALHYPLNTWKGAFYSRRERVLMNNSDVFLFGGAWVQVLLFNVEGDAGVINEPLDETVAHGGAWSPDAALDVRRLAKTDRAF